MEHLITVNVFKMHPKNNTKKHIRNYGSFKYSVDYYSDRFHPFQVGKVASKPLVSGELRTRRNMFRYGRYEVRMKAPDVQPGNPDIDGNWATEK